MAEVRARVPPVQPAGRQEVAAQRDERRVVAGGVAPRGDRGQEKKGGAEVIEEQEQDGGEPHDVHQRRPAALRHGPGVYDIDLLYAADPLL